MQHFYKHLVEQRMQIFIFQSDVIKKWRVEKLNILSYFETILYFVTILSFVDSFLEKNKYLNHF